MFPIFKPKPCSGVFNMHIQQYLAVPHAGGHRIHCLNMFKRSDVNNSCQKIQAKHLSKKSVACGVKWL